MYIFKHCLRFYALQKFSYLFICLSAKEINFLSRTEAASPNESYLSSNNKIKPSVSVTFLMNLPMGATASYTNFWRDKRPDCNEQQDWRGRKIKE